MTYEHKRKTFEEMLDEDMKLAQRLLREHEDNCDFCRGFAEFSGVPYKKTNDFTLEQRRKMC